MDAQASIHAILVWLNDVARWEVWSGIWNTMNAPFFTTAMIVIGALFTERRFRVNTEASQSSIIAEAESKQIESKAAADVEEIISTAPEIQGGNDGLREETKALAKYIRDWVRSTAKADPDGRHKRVYERLNGNPKSLVQAIADRVDTVDQELADKVIRALVLWGGFERGRAANKVVPESVRNALKETKDSLPPIGEIFPGK